MRAPGDRLGVYEPLWLELPDGTLRSTSYLNLDPHELCEETSIWHHGCLVPDGLAGAAES
jgi:hypothetical protein